MHTYKTTKIYASSLEDINQVNNLIKTHLNIFSLEIINFLS